MTLDCTLRKHAIKGHFCSLLISNIFCYPLFHRSAVCFIHHISKTLNYIFSNENTLCFLCVCNSAKGESIVFVHGFSTGFMNLFSHLYITRNTAVYFLLTQVHFSSSSLKAVKPYFSSDCTFLSSVSIL